VARLEIIGPSVHDVVPLEGGSLSVGKAARADLVVASDPAMSRVHLILEQVGGMWFVRDLGARNGTFVNHTRVIGQHALRDGDEVRLGSTRLIFRDPQQHSEPTTATLAPPPHLTDRERDVLIELCRPVLQGSAFTQPAAVRDVAARLVITNAAVKQHLGRLYDKFGIFPESNADRRVCLANEALGRGAVTLADIRSQRT
jgi:hypothetical protein